jgi:hypothetical protein
MIYGLSLLLLTLGLVVGVPAMRRLAPMLTIKKNSGMTNLSHGMPIWCVSGMPLSAKSGSAVGYLL